MDDLKRYIRAVPDFPTPGILFRDITPLLLDPRGFAAAVSGLREYIRERSPDAIVGIESRGFIFATPIAAELRLPFVPVRKPGKLPAARMSVEVSLEYGTTQLDIHSDALRRGQRVVIVDDLLATGGTAAGAAKLVELLGAEVAGVAFVVELEALRGRDKLRDYDVRSLVRYA
jgi:adenine phosphoribosyltransferase